MLHIEERKLARIPTIIEGETGVGKTYLLRVYAALLREKAVAGYDVPTFLRTKVTEFFEGRQARGETMGQVEDDFVKYRVKLELRRHVKATPERLMRAVLFFTAEIVRHDKERAAEAIRALLDAIIAGLKDMPLLNIFQLRFYLRLVMEPPDYRLRLPSLKVHEFRSLLSLDRRVVAKRLQDCWKEAVAGPQLGLSFLFPSSALEAMTDIRRMTDSVVESVKVEAAAGGIASRPLRTEDGKLVLSGQSAVVRWLFAWTLTEPMETYFPVLLHTAFTMEELRRQVLPAQAYADHLTQLAKEHVLESSTLPTVVVFLDEVNTSSLLGVVQDLMVHHVLDGQPVSEDVFWICATNPYRPAAAQQADGNTVGFRSDYQVCEPAMFWLGCVTGAHACARARA